ncbi:unnamed protein product [Rangifer tarandus platyrhynchus]|uniref:Uncharacterized protein n=1 Tax=Rangifer tarandus platyrhynchus TaxID=3082113 RepID=A0ABN8YR66_RANTA|nr:unnamed protein product [Rangifer tarandus platyrhynchus]
MGSPYLSSPVEVSQARCGPVTPNSAPKHILPKCDSDQTRSVSLTPCRPSRSAVPLRAALGSAYVAASPPPGPSVNRTLGHPQTLPLYPVATGSRRFASFLKTSIGVERLGDILQSLPCSKLRRPCACPLPRVPSHCGRHSAGESPLRYTAGSRWLMYTQQRHHSMQG